MRLTSCVTGLACLSFVSASFAWGPGHRIGAAIADSYLTPEARASIADLLGSESIIDVAEWADRVRKLPEYKWSDTRHGARIADGAETFDLRRDCPNGCAVSSIEELTAVLRDPTADRRKRVDALKFLVHFVVDLHQPLHVNTPGQSKSAPTVEYRSEKMSLHKLWDRMPVLYTNETWEECARRLRAAITREQFEEWASKTDPSDWATESQQAAKIAYRVPKNGKPGEAYFNRCVPIADKRISMGGVRLAVRLNAIFAPRPTSSAGAP